MATASPIASARRSTELSLVVMAALITAGAYTLASLGSNARIPTRIVPFLAVLLGVLVRRPPRRAVVRPRRRRHDAAARRAAARHRLRDDHPARRSPRRSADHVEHRRHRRRSSRRCSSSSAPPTSPATAGRSCSSASACCCCRWCPASGDSVGGARIWVSLGPINFQPGEFAKIALAIFFAGYLAERRELIAAGTWKVGPLHLPEPRHLLPIVFAWALRRRGHGRPEGPRLVAAVLHPVRRDDVGGHRAGGVPADRARPVRPARLRRVAAVRPRADPRRHLARPVVAARSTRATRSSRRCTGSTDGGIAGTGLGLGQPEPGARGAERLHLRLDRRGARPVRRDGGADRLPAADRRRAAHRDCAPRTASRSCSPSVSRRSSACRRSSSSAASSRSSRSPASRCRSSATAARRWCPTTSCSPC